MKLLLLLTLDPAEHKQEYSRLKYVIPELYARGVKITAMYVTNEAVPIFSKKERKPFAREYIKLSRRFNFPVLVCGKYAKDFGLDEKTLSEGTVLSGTMELTTLCLKADKILEV